MQKITDLRKPTTITTPCMANANPTAQNIATDNLDHTMNKNMPHTKTFDVKVYLLFIFILHLSYSD